MIDPVIDIIAKSPCAGMLPKTIGSVTLRELAFDAITSVAPFRGQEKAVSVALKSQIGAAFPAPNHTTGKGDTRAVWTGMDQAMVLGVPVDPIKGAAMSDQSDAWTCVALEGDDTREVLARVTPLDLRPSTFKVGHAARTEVAHMSAVLMRSGERRYDVIVFRSMAKTLLHDLTEAMASVAGRGKPD